MTKTLALSVTCASSAILSAFINTCMRHCRDAASIWEYWSWDGKATCLISMSVFLARQSVQSKDDCRRSRIMTITSPQATMMASDPTTTWDSRDVYMAIDELSPLNTAFFETPFQHMRSSLLLLHGLNVY
ncbi:hypothetical protein BGZ61DRAFT_135485 [Ilyonectria robusta]|uniref:uncharacterized protein n=1 Tax=Ilyonectria robusta TaxID=1079257 RepID=UPI001E8EB519|nr:uncharacterized protein BGZ61DRAFT_135485 [Ilyonectria robusta]KAH8735121.1 hypothetical protein BGZ61DRAFT_135485 [Ilyonectria robusta]